MVRNLASRNAGRIILMDIEHELGAMDQARLTTNGIHFDSIEGDAWMNRVFQERLDKLEVELLDSGVLKKEETTNEPALSTFVPSNLETRLGSVPAVTQRPQSSSEPRQRTDVLDRLGEPPVRRTIHPLRRLGPVNSTTDTSGTSRSETTSTGREERQPDRSSLILSRPIPSPWHVYKQDLVKLNLQTVRFAADAIKMLNGARLSVNGLYSIPGVDWLIAAGINFSSTTALRFDNLEGLTSNNTMGPVNARLWPDVKMNHSEGNREKTRKILDKKGTDRKTCGNFQTSTSKFTSRERKGLPKTGDVERYGGVKIRKDETIFAAYDKVEMRKAKILIVANSDFAHTSKSLFWLEVIILAAVDLELMQSVSMAIEVQRQTEMNTITIVFAGINDHITVGVS